MHRDNRGVRDDKYGKTADGTVPTEFLLIPTGEADMMRFGILPWYEDLMNCKQYAMGAFGSASKKVRDHCQFEVTSTFGFPDLIPMAAPMLRQAGSTKIRLPIPTELCCGLTSYKEGSVIFCER